MSAQVSVTLTGWLVRRDQWDQLKGASRDTHREGNESCQVDVKGHEAVLLAQNAPARCLMIGMQGI